MRSHAYSLLRTIFASVPELGLLTAAMPERLRLMVTLASWCALRLGETVELRRGEIDLSAEVIRIRRAAVRTKGSYSITTPKSDAGMRDVAIPPRVLPLIEAHLAKHVGNDCDSLAFPADGGGHLQPSTLCRYWYEARAQAGRKDLRWHDLRHSGAVLAAATGASLAELMQRLGHSTPQAAMRYQHVASGRPAEVAALLSKLAEGGQTPTHCCQHRQKANCPNGIATLGEFADTPNYCPKTLVGTSPWDTKRSVRTVPMDAPDMSIADAADYLGVTERTVRKGDFRLNRTVLRTFETIVINPEPLMQQFIDLR